MYSIRLHQRQVIIPTWVWNLRDGHPVSDLHDKDFQIFEDGVRQDILSVKFENYYGINAADDLGVVAEYATTPRGIWRSRGGSQDAGMGYYLVTYAPHHWTAGTCHRIGIKVARKNSKVRTDSQYCIGSATASDSLKDTNRSKQMESHVASGSPGKIPIAVQTGIFFSPTHVARLQVSLDFSGYRFKQSRCGGTPKFSIAILGTIYRKDGTLAKRFSDIRNGIATFNCGLIEVCAEKTERDVRRERRLLNRCMTCSEPEPRECSPKLGYEGILPERYETQIDLPPGDYNLKLVLDDGNEFGRVEVPFTIPEHTRESLAISSVMLGNSEFHADSQNAAVSRFLPLICKGTQFTPAGKTRFKKVPPLFASRFWKSDPLVAYFEVYETPLNEVQSQTLYFRLKITDAKTSEIRLDSGQLDVASWRQAGSAIIPIAQQIDIDKLASGSYRLEVQASDSLGRSTVSRAAEFTIE